MEFERTVDWYMTVGWQDTASISLGMGWWALGELGFFCGVQGLGIREWLLVGGYFPVSSTMTCFL